MLIEQEAATLNCGFSNKKWNITKAHFLPKNHVYIFYSKKNKKISVY